MIGAPRKQHVIVRSVSRANPETAASIGATGTSTVHEGIGQRGYLGPDIKPIQQGVRIGGVAVTVFAHPGDNMMLHAAVEMCQPGDVLVVATTAPSTHGMFGDLLATSLQQRGVIGLVMDAGVRDVADLNEMGFPVWTRHVSCQGTVKATPGSVNVPIAIGGVMINSGDVVCADDDGVVVVARQEADWALQMAEARIAKEAGTRSRLEAGELGVDFYGLRPLMERLGVRYVETVDDIDLDA